MNPTHFDTRSPWRWIVPLAVLILIGGLILGTTLLRRGTHGPTSPAPDVSEVPADPSAEPMQRRNPSTSRGKPGVADVEDWQRNMEKADKKAEREAQNQHLAMAARFAGETVDARWAGAQQAAILTASKAGQIAQLQAEPETIDIDCKSSTCRIQADFAKRSVATDWLTLFLMNVGGGISNTTYEYSTNPDGSARLTVYGVAPRAP